MRHANLCISLILLCVPTLFQAQAISKNQNQNRNQNQTMPQNQNASLNQVVTTAAPGTVALTFDDGPDPIHTTQVLETLRKYNIKATFFVIGESAAQHPDMIRQIVAEGHAIGNHTWSHPNLNRLNPRQLEDQVLNTQETIENAIGIRPVCLRPPYGLANHRVKDYIRSQGIIPVGIGYSSFDYLRRGVQRLTQWVVSNAKSGQVILMHDANNSHGQTMDALPQIIEGIQKKGLGFSTICYPPNYAEARAKILSEMAATTRVTPQAAIKTQQQPGQQQKTGS